MEIITKGKLNTQCGKTYLTFDCGPYYYKCEFSADIFPEQFHETYLDVVTKALQGYSDDTTRILGFFEHETYSEDNNFNITIHVSSSFYKFSHKVVIPLTAYKKDKVDYLAEQLETLQQAFSQLSTEHELLKTCVFGAKMNLMKEIENEESSISQELTSVSVTDSESEEEDEKPTYKSKHSKGKGKPKNVKK